MKIIITGINKIDKLDIAKYIADNNDLSIVPSFTSDDTYKGKISDRYIYYLSPNTIDLSYKNNAFIYIQTKNYLTTGVTCDDYYNNDILCVSIEEFNNIIDAELTDTLVIWLDTKFHNNENIKFELNETKYLVERLNKIKYLYFLDESKDLINNIIYKYINSDELIRKDLLEEYC